MISACGVDPAVKNNLTPPTTSPEDRRIPTLSAVPNPPAITGLSAHGQSMYQAGGKQLPTYYCGIGWVNIPSFFKKFLKSRCVSKVQSIYRKGIIGSIGLKRGTRLNSKQLFVYDNIMQRAMQREYFGAVKLLEQRAKTLGRPKQTKVSSFQDANYANAVMESFITGSSTFEVTDPITRSPRRLTYKQLAIFARKIALLGIDPKDVIFLPPSITSEIDRIKKAFPMRKVERSHLIERVARLYLTTIKELKLSSDASKINYDNVGKQIVQRVRQLSWEAINNRSIPTPVANIGDTAAEAQYKKIADDTTGKLIERFLKGMTQERVHWAKLKRIAIPGTSLPPKYVAEIGFRSIPAMAFIERGDTRELRLTSKNTPIKRRFRLMEKIKQCDFILEQLMKALKKFYRERAGITPIGRNGAGYTRNRQALDRMIVKMLASTIMGLRKTFRKNYGPIKADGTATKKDADDMVLTELEANDVILKPGTKDPHYVKFDRDPSKSTTGAPLYIFINPIVNGRRGNTYLRRAVAMRRYARAKKMLDAKFKNPRVRAQKLQVMIRSLVDGLKSLSDDDLLLSRVLRIEASGRAKIVITPDVFIKFARSAWLGKTDKPQEGLGAFTRPTSNEGAKSYVDIIDRSKVLFKQIVNSNKELLKGRGRTRAAKRLDGQRRLRALAWALMKLVNYMQDHHRDLTGSRWTTMGKGAKFKITPARVWTVIKIPVLDGSLNPMKDGNGDPIYRTRHRLVPGYKVTDLKLKDRFAAKTCKGGCSGKGPVWSATLATGADGKPSVVHGGSVSVKTGGGALSPDGKGSPWSAAAILDAKLDLHLKFPKLWNFSIGTGLQTKSFHADASMESSLDPNNPYAIHYPTMPPSAGGSKWGYTARGYMSIAPKINKKLTLNAKVEGGVVDAKAWKIPTLGKSTVLGGGFSLGLEHDLFSMVVSFVAGYMNNPVFGKTRDGKPIAWVDKDATKIAFNLALGGTIVPGTLALDGYYGFSKLSNKAAVDNDGDGVLDCRLSADGITPISVPGKRHVVGGNATLGLLKDSKKKPRLLLTAGGMVVLGSNGVTSGVTDMRLAMGRLKVVGIVHPKVALSAGIRYVALKLEGAWPSGNPNTEDMGGGLFDIGKSGVAARFGFLVAPWSWLGLGANFFISDVRNRTDHPGSGTRYGFLFSITLSPEDVIGALRGRLK